MVKVPARKRQGVKRQPTKQIMFRAKGRMVTFRAQTKRRSQKHV